MDCVNTLRPLGRCKMCIRDRDYIYSRQLLQTVISNLPIGLCLLSVRGEINMVNRRFSMDLELPETGTTGRNLSQFLPQPCKGMDFRCV